MRTQENVKVSKVSINYNGKALECELVRKLEFDDMYNAEGDLLNEQDKAAVYAGDVTPMVYSLELVYKGLSVTDYLGAVLIDSYEEGQRWLNGQSEYEFDMFEGVTEDLVKQLDAIVREVG